MSEINNLEVFRVLNNKMLFSSNVETVCSIFLKNAFSNICKRTKEIVIEKPGKPTDTIHPDDRVHLQKGGTNLLWNKLRKLKVQDCTAGKSCEVCFRLKKCNG